ncbi:MAG: hypothetical protein DHS20C18_07980 [Saprospiraceae bacterium]|nr:MAG: hypothetical protein DHS20C18_07980 [Saprospiraceae bacterium]
MQEKQSRSVIKAVTYRFLATMATIGLAYAFTGSLEIAGKIGVLDFIIKFTIYYLNERIWSRTTWGYHKIANQSNEHHDYFSGKKQDETVDRRSTQRNIHTTTIRR